MKKSFEFDIIRLYWQASIILPSGPNMRFFFLLTCISLLTLTADEQKTHFHSFTVKNIEGKEVALKDFKGKTILLVNVASKCGLTQKNYKELVELKNKYAEKNFEILAFPANNFGKQEPGTDEEIKDFCLNLKKVNFPVFSKVSVLGDDKHALFAYLTSAENPDFQGDIKWNFEKFLISPEGQLIRRFRSKVSPLSNDITEALDKCISENNDLKKD